MFHRVVVVSGRERDEHRAAEGRPEIIKPLKDHAGVDIEDLIGRSVDGLHCVPLHTIAVFAAPAEGPHGYYALGQYVFPPYMPPFDLNMFGETVS